MEETNLEWELLSGHTSSASTSDFCVRVSRTRGIDGTGVESARGRGREGERERESRERALTSMQAGDWSPLIT